MACVLSEIPLELLIEDLIPIVDIVDVLLALDAHAVATEVCPLGNLCLKILCHRLYAVLLWFISLVLELLDSFEVSIVHSILVKHVPSEDLLPATLPLLPSH